MRITHCLEEAYGCVWSYRGRSLEKDWRFPFKLSKNGPDKSKTQRKAHLEQGPAAVQEADGGVPAAGTGRALRNTAPKSRSVGERDTVNHRKHRSLARAWPAPYRWAEPYPEPYTAGAWPAPYSLALCQSPPRRTAGHRPRGSASPRGRRSARRSGRPRSTWG
jgi:hypothetical protein